MLVSGPASNLQLEAGLEGAVNTVQPLTRNGDISTERATGGRYRR